jgi:hypothetical protein
MNQKQGQTTFLCPPDKAGSELAIRGFKENVVCPFYEVWHGVKFP